MINGILHADNYSVDVINSWIVLGILICNISRMLVVFEDINLIQTKLLIIDSSRWIIDRLTGAREFLMF